MKKEELNINVFNKQRARPVDRVDLLAFAASLSRRLRISGGFSIVLVSDRSMRRYNRDYAGDDYPTDVLSFPCDDSGLNAEENYVGDVLISVETADRQKKGTLNSELKVLALHGILHLMGYDHEVDQGLMAALEEDLKREFSLQ